MYQALFTPRVQFIFKKSLGDTDIISILRMRKLSLKELL